MTSLLAGLIGLCAGLHAATWGMYKDAPHEGFSRRKYARSPILGFIIGILAQPALGLDPHRASDIVVLFGVIYAIERALAEIYKTFLRDEDQSKYFIPMQLHVLGKPVQSRTARLLAGLLYTTLLLALVVGVSHLDQNAGGRHDLLTVLLVGALGGWISAFGGAWKDAPSEGFQLLKFFRSPALAALYALGMSYLTGSLLVLTLAATGYTVATTETYKTFFFPSKPRGKFAGRPVLHPELLRWRQRFVPLYVAIWLGIAGSLTVALVTHERDSGTLTSASEQLMRSTLIFLLASTLPAVPETASGTATAQELPGRLPDGVALGGSMDLFLYEGTGITAATFRRSSLRRNGVGTEFGVSLFPQALPLGGLILAPDLGPAFNISLPGATVLLKAGGSAIVGIGQGIGAIPGFHLGSALVIRGSPRLGVRVDVIRHFYRVEGQSEPFWSVGLGFTGLPRIGS